MRFRYKAMQYTMYVMVILLLVLMAAVTTSLNNSRYVFPICSTTFPLVAMSFIFEYKADKPKRRRKIYSMSKKTCAICKHTMFLIAFISIPMIYICYETVTAMFLSVVTFFTSLMGMIFGMMEEDAYE